MKRLLLVLFYIILVGCTKDSVLESDLVYDALKEIRMDFIDGDQLYSLDMTTDVAFELSPITTHFYTITGVYDGFVIAIFESDFDLHTQLPNHSSIIDEESFETDLGFVELITLDADLGTGEDYKGTYTTYYAYLKVTDHEGYLLNYTLFDDSLSTKHEFIAMLKSMRRHELGPYEKVSLKNRVISSNIGIDLVLKEGYFTNDEELWNATGAKWVGEFEIRTSNGNDVVVTSLNQLWGEKSMFFYAPEFKLSMKDYNKDGLLDFALSQYVSSNICYYKLFSVLKDGRVVKTPFDVEVIAGSPTRENSPYLTIEGDEVVSTFYDNTVGLYYKNYFAWNGEKYFLVNKEELK